MQKKIVHAYLWDFTGTLITHGLGLVISIILARLLEVEDFGIISMALVFISISSSISDFGLTQALIQKKENDDLTYSSVFYFSFIVGVFLFISFQFLAKSISLFYAEVRIEYILRLLSIVLIINSLTVVPIAILSRDLDFKSLNIRIVISKGFGGIVGVFLALNNYGIMALLVQQILGATISCFAVWNMSIWRPKLNFSYNALKQLFSFSFFVFLNRLTNQIVNQLDILVVGKLFTPIMLGYYGRAQSLISIVNIYSSNSINNIFFPVLSQRQDDKQIFDRIFFSMLSIVSFLTFLLSGIIIFLSEPIVIGLLGEKWRPSIFIFEILALRIFSYPMSAILLTAIKAKGKAKEDFLFGLLRRFIKLSIFIIAFYYDFELFLYSLVIISYLNISINYIMCSTLLEVSFGKQIKELLSFGLIFSICWMIVEYCYYFQFGLYLDGIFKSSIFLAIYLLFTFLFRFDFLNQIKKNVQNFFKN